MCLRFGSATVSLEVVLSDFLFAWDLLFRNCYRFSHVFFIASLHFNCGCLFEFFADLNCAPAAQLVAIRHSGFIQYLYYLYITHPDLCFYSVLVWEVVRDGVRMYLWDCVKSVSVCFDGWAGNNNNEDKQKLWTRHWQFLKLYPVFGWFSGNSTLFCDFWIFQCTQKTAIALRILTIWHSTFFFSGGVDFWLSLNWTKARNGKCVRLYTKEKVDRWF